MFCFCWTNVPLEHEIHMFHTHANLAFMQSKPCQCSCGSWMRVCILYRWGMSPPVLKPLLVQWHTTSPGLNSKTKHSQSMSRTHGVSTRGRNKASIGPVRMMQGCVSYTATGFESFRFCTRHHGEHSRRVVGLLAKSKTTTAQASTAILMY